MTKKKQTNPTGKIENDELAALLKKPRPDDPFDYEAYGEYIAGLIPRNPSFKTDVPNKRQPEVQAFVDRMKLFLVQSFSELVEILKEILPFWIEQEVLYSVSPKCVTDCIRKIAGFWRDTDNIDVVAIPGSDLQSIIDWMTDAERAFKKPDHLIALAVAVKNFTVSRSTLNRAIKDGRLQRYGTSSLIRVDAVEVAKFWQRRI